jgi:hypothetical protein
MADQPQQSLEVDGGCLYDGPALKPPPGVRLRPKKLARFDDPVIPCFYWYVTAAFAAAALVLGVLVGVFLLR